MIERELLVGDRTCLRKLVFPFLALVGVMLIPTTLSISYIGLLGYLWGVGLIFALAGLVIVSSVLQWLMIGRVRYALVDSDLVIHSNFSRRKLVPVNKIYWVQVSGGADFSMLFTGQGLNGQTFPEVTIYYDGGVDRRRVLRWGEDSRDIERDLRTALLPQDEEES